MRGEEDVGLGGMVVMTGVVEITTEAGMGALSWSMLGLDGSSEDAKKDAEVKGREVINQKPEPESGVCSKNKVRQSHRQRNVLCMETGWKCDARIKE